MVYLIKSASWNSEANKFEFILKIGYTKDQSAKNRFIGYGNHNPTIEILFKIPNATERHEGALHEYFREFRIYNREWYEYREEIIEFFKTHTTAESLDRDLPEYKFTQERQSSRTVRLNKFLDFVDSLEESDLKAQLQNYLDEDGSKFRLRFLYNLDKSGLLTDSVLENIPENNFGKYFKILGADRIRANNYNTTELDKELVYNTPEFKQNLANIVYSEFHEGDVISKKDVKDKLKDIYQRVGYKTAARATELKRWFLIKDKEVNTNGKRLVYFKLVRKL